MGEEPPTPTTSRNRPSCFAFWGASSNGRSSPCPRALWRQQRVSSCGDTRSITTPRRRKASRTWLQTSSRAPASRRSRLPRTYLAAVVSVEDHRFYQHPGFDALATGRALFNDLRAGAIVEGGSTIRSSWRKTSSSPRGKSWAKDRGGVHGI